MNYLHYRVPLVTQVILALEVILALQDQRYITHTHTKKSNHIKMVMLQCLSIYVYYKNKMLLLLP